MARRGLRDSSAEGGLAERRRCACALAWAGAEREGDGPPRVDRGGGRQVEDDAAPGDDVRLSPVRRSPMRA